MLRYAFIVILRNHCKKCILFTCVNQAFILPEFMRPV